MNAPFLRKASHSIENFKSFQHKEYIWSGFWFNFSKKIIRISVLYVFEHILIIDLLKFSTIS
jgi:hypothetical protein